MNKRGTLVTLFIIIGVAIAVILIAQRATQDVQDKITIYTAVFGLIAILYQLRSDHKIKRAEFIYSLNDSFNDDKDIATSYKLLKSIRGTDQDLDKEQCSEMGTYIMFFMVLNYLVTQRLVSMKMIDKIFSNKFFLLCNNKDVQTHQLEETHINYPIMELYEKWYNYRLVYTDELLYEKHCYSNNEKIFHKKNNGIIKYKFKKKNTVKKHLKKLFGRPNIKVEKK